MNSGAIDNHGEQTSTQTSRSRIKGTLKLKGGGASGGDREDSANNESHRDSPGQLSGRSMSTSGRENRTRGGRSKSQGIASSINSARRNRMRSYVASELTEEEISSEKATERERQAKELGDLAELAVLEDLHAKGFKAERMPENNPGFDIEACNPHTGEVLFIEVKAEYFAWSEKGVGLTSRQYAFAKEKRNAFYLAVVENVRLSPRHIYYLQDPVGYITEYRFDLGWQGLAGDIRPLSATEEAELSTIQQIQALTDSEYCRSLISYCDNNGYPLPEVGLELINSDGEVVFECIELSWEQERIGVVLEADQLQEVESIQPDWKFFLCDGTEKIERQLDITFNHETQSEASL